METTAPQLLDETRPLGVYASWGSRLGAWIIDALLLSFASWFLVRTLTPPVDLTDVLGGHGRLILFVLQLLIAAGYFSLCHSLRGQTVGKAAVGLKVFDSQTLGRLSLGRAFLRWAVTLLSWIALIVPGLLDALSPLWNEDSNQAWHDKIARSVVMRVRGQGRGAETAVTQRLWTSPGLKFGSIAALALGILGVPATGIAALVYWLGHGPERGCGSDGCWFGTDSPAASHVNLVHALSIGGVTVALFALAVLLGVIQMHRSGMPLRLVQVHLVLAAATVAAAFVFVLIPATLRAGVVLGIVSVMSLFVCWVRILRLPRRVWRAET